MTAEPYDERIADYQLDEANAKAVSAARTGMSPLSICASGHPRRSEVARCWLSYLITVVLIAGTGED